MKIHYQCSNCGKRFQTSPILGVPDGMYFNGCRAVGDAFYCEDCVKTWAERNGDEFDRQYKDPEKAHNKVSQKAFEKFKGLLDERSYEE